MIVYCSFIGVLSSNNKLFACISIAEYNVLSE